MAKKISEFDSITSAAYNDVLPIVDVSLSTTKKITRSDLLYSYYTSTIYVAASDSTASDKERATGTYTGDGIADNVQIKAAIDALSEANGGRVMLQPGAYYTTAVIVGAANVTLEFMPGAWIMPQADIDVIQLFGRGFSIVGSGCGCGLDCGDQANWDSSGILLTEVFGYAGIGGRGNYGYFRVDNFEIRGDSQSYGAGINYYFNRDNGSGYSCYGNNVSNIWISNLKKPITLNRYGTANANFLSMHNFEDIQVIEPPEDGGDHIKLVNAHGNRFSGQIQMHQSESDGAAINLIDSDQNAFDFKIWDTQTNHGVITVDRFSAANDFSKCVGLDSGMYFDKSKKNIPPKTTPIYAGLSDNVRTSPTTRPGWSTGDGDLTDFLAYALGNTGAGTTDPNPLLTITHSGSPTNPGNMFRPRSDTYTYWTADETVTIEVEPASGDFDHVTVVGFWCSGEEQVGTATLSFDVGAGYVEYSSQTDVGRGYEWVVKTGKNNVIKIKLVLVPESGETIEIYHMWAVSNQPGRAYMSGVNPIAWGDVNLSTADTISFVGSEAAGDVLYHNGTTWVRLAAGSNGDVLTLVAGVPAWVTP